MTSPDATNVYYFTHAEKNTHTHTYMFEGVLSACVAVPLSPAVVSHISYNISDQGDDNDDDDDRVGEVFFKAHVHAP